MPSLDLTFDVQPVKQILNEERPGAVHEPLVAPKVLHSLIEADDDALATVLHGRENVTSIIAHQSDRLLVIVGPCSIHDPATAMEYAALLRNLQLLLEDDIFIVMRAYLEKPRTTTGWKGLINDPDLDGSFNIEKGLRVSRQLFVDINGLGVPLASELLDIMSTPFYTDLLTLGAIGARTTESQVHRELASGVEFPVGFKNSTDGRLGVAIDAIGAATKEHHFVGVGNDGQVAITQTRGNENCFAILRGGTNGPNYDAESVHIAVDALRARKQNESLIIDCSHGNSLKNHRNQPIVAKEVADQLRDGEQAIVGVMIESNFCEGRQDIPKDGQTSKLKPGVSITDACIDWQTTVFVLEDLAAAVRERRKRQQKVLISGLGSESSSSISS
ncbi:MAG: hypothetical protein M1812_007350 [Candelaria pacifica]|nr:MAG: hypothetical protein M1812_007350 [Candelaria pacifica]